jgi:hypothetical protein
VAKQSSRPPGPSNAYLRVVQGKDSAGKYAATVMTAVDRQIVKSVRRAAG